MNRHIGVKTPGSDESTMITDEVRNTGPASMAISRQITAHEKDMESNFTSIYGVNSEPATSSVTDIDGNEYPTVIIGKQEWMTENLRVKHYNNGNLIPSDKQIDWQSTNAGAYTIYPHAEIDGLHSDAEVLNAYGALYNWYAVDDRRGLCPTGWHVPTDEDWTVLTDYLGDKVARSFGRLQSATGGKLKSKRSLPDEHPRWSNPNSGATNESGFSALPGGSRYGNGHFGDIGYNGTWWSATFEPVSSWAVSRVTARFWIIYYHSDNLYNGISNKQNQFSVRCVRDSQGPE
ncbi:MAG: fibrobacter succinogenes major paralogous domain-containing protein [Cyclobacteriaceae bacterium]|nr:fibrobacter succinogenes major paralogous domain-containing protein [Cyclobacteriaceae bacterium]